MDATNRGESMKGSPCVDVVTLKFSRRASLDCPRGRKLQIEDKRERRHSESDIVRRTSISEKGKVCENNNYHHNLSLSTSFSKLIYVN